MSRERGGEGREKGLATRAASSRGKNPSCCTLSSSYFFLFYDDESDYDGLCVPDEPSNVPGDYDEVLVA